MANAARITERGSDGIAFETPTPASQPGDVFPAGTVVDYAGSSAPAGWLICDGSLVSRATYPQLFANIGTQYGAGDGSTTFGLPDARGRHVVGKHTSGTFTTLGATGGEENHVLTVNEMPSHNHGGGTGTGTTGGGSTGGESNDHTHTWTQSTSVLNVNGGSSFAVPLLNNGVNNTGGRSAGHTHSCSAQSVPSLAISSQGGGTSHNNMPPYIVLNKIIRAY